jgi:DNA repair ATPase RecN
MYLEETYFLSSYEEIPLDQLQPLYTKALLELRDLKVEFEDFQLTSREYDQELEAALDDYKERESEMQAECDRLRQLSEGIEAKNKRLEAEIERAEREMAKWQGKYKSEVAIVEKENDTIKKKMEDNEA